MTDIPYTLIRSRRKTLSIQITPAGEVVVRCPARMAKKEAAAFVEQKRGWIEKHLAALREQAQPPLTREALAALVREAKEELPDRAARLAPVVGVDYGRVTIRCQKSRWGSCSAKGNLNFNCLLMLCPEEVREYVVLHELCHRLQMNHSPAFWAEMARVCPDYKARVRWLRQNGGSIMGRVGKEK